MGRGGGTTKPSCPHTVLGKLFVIIVYSTSPPKKLFMILKYFLNGRNEKVVSLQGVEKRKGLLTRVEE